MKNVQNTPPEYNLQRFDLFSSLLSIVNDENPANNTHKTIAEYLLKNLHRLGELTIYDVAEECFVSRSSIHRFLKQIGFDQFGNLEQFVKDSYLHYRAYYDYVNRENFVDAVQIKMNEMMQDISRLSGSAPIKELAEMIHEHERVYIFLASTAGSAAKHFQEELLAVGKLIYVYTNSGIQADSLTELKKEDLLIICSITGNFAFVVSEGMKSIEASKVLITLNHADIFRDYYDSIFYMSSQLQDKNPFHSYGLRNVYTKYGLLYFLDLVYNQYIKEYFPSDIS